MLLSSRADHFHLISSLVPTRNSSFVVCLISSFSCFRLKATFLFFAIDLERWLPPCDVNLPFCISSLVFSQQCLIQVIIGLPSKMGASSSISQWPKNSSFMFLVLWLFFSHRTLTLLLERSVSSTIWNISPICSILTVSTDTELLFLQYCVNLLRGLPAYTLTSL